MIEGAIVWLVFWICVAIGLSSIVYIEINK